VLISRKMQEFICDSFCAIRHNAPSTCVRYHYLDVNKRRKCEREHHYPHYPLIRR